MSKTPSKVVVGYTEEKDYRCLENLQRSFMDICLVYCGYEQNEPGRVFDNRPRENYVLHFVRSGKGILRIGDRDYELGAGDAFYIPPGVHCAYKSDDLDPWVYTWVGFAGMKAETYVRNSGFSLENPVGHITQIEEVFSLVNQILDCHNMDYSSELRRDAYLMLIFAILIRSHESNTFLEGGEKHADDPDFVVKAIDFIEHHYEQNIRIGEIAAYLGVSRSHFSSTFKKCVGCTIQEYIVSLRMSKAAALLRDTTMPVYAVANAVGYSDQLAFSKIFKQKFDVSPVSYRKNEQDVVILKQKGEFKHSIL